MMQKKGTAQLSKNHIHRCAENGSRSPSSQNVTEINNMTSNMTSLRVAMSPELN
jgi:hypothetical protein